jgi:hypothetical protein
MSGHGRDRRRAQDNISQGLLIGPNSPGSTSAPLELRFRGAGMPALVTAGRVHTNGVLFLEPSITTDRHRLYRGLLENRRRKPASYWTPGGTLHTRRPRYPRIVRVPQYFTRSIMESNRWWRTGVLVVC